MIDFDPQRFKTKPYPYQLDGVKHILKNPAAAIFDEMGVGKTKQIIDSACILYENKEIEMVIVVSPASVRTVWDDEETGEVAKHCWKDYIGIRYDANYKQRNLPIGSNQLLWVTISYSFLRARCSEFLNIVQNSKKPFLLVLDESSYVKSEKAQQTKACWKLRQLADRCVIANGTPVANSIMDLWSQFNILDPQAINHMNYYHYRAKYAIMITEQNHTFNTFYKKIVGFKTEEVEELKRQLAPWIIRREKKDVLKDLPPKLPPVYMEVPLSQSAWKMYEEMREESVAWLDTQAYSASVNAAVMTGRLSQITSGFLGGLSFLNGEESEELPKIKEVDDSKLQAFLEWRQANPNLQVLVWCRFVAEMNRLHRELTKLGFKPGLLRGKGKEDDIAGFKRNDLTDLIGHPRAGGYGLNLTNCHTCVYLSMTYSLIDFQQSSDRLHRNGQTLPVSYLFFMATSPTGAKTVDHMTVKAVINKENMAKWTVEKWLNEI